MHLIEFWTCFEEAAGLLQSEIQIYVDHLFPIGPSAAFIWNNKAFWSGLQGSAQGQQVQLWKLFLTHLACHCI